MQHWTVVPNVDPYTCYNAKSGIDWSVELLQYFIDTFKQNFKQQRGAFT